MGFAIGIIIFITCMVASIALGYSMIPALLVGLAIFVILGMRRGFTLEEIFRSGMESVKESAVVIKVITIIGLITAVWRISGTIPVFIYYGIRIITPSMFLVVTYLLACILSYALGTSFGVTGTLGVIFMALARSGGVNPVITAGVILSGVYFGDRGSPVASSAHLVAGVTRTDIMTNVKYMMKTCVIPVVLTLCIYAFLSVRNPIGDIDAGIIGSLEDTFSLSVIAFIPAVLMLILPLFRLAVTTSILVSAAAGAVIAYCVQGMPILDILKTCIMGYRSADAGLGAILNGGGVISMVEVVIILIISCAYSGIFSCTGMMEPVYAGLEKSCRKTGRFATCLIFGITGTILFCNQTITTLLCGDILSEPYRKTGGNKQELAIDIENSSIVAAGFIPWCLGCKVPLTFMGVGAEAIPYAVYLFLIPVCYLFTKRIWFKDRV
ncbi:MAG: hypothetical protein IJH90_07830 [Mogibacterium sp.]|nr:hypothetical protein [Mogibacterium sp.]